MYWMRRHRHFGSWTAIFALSIQLVLAFGHVHLENFRGSSAAIASASQPQPDTSDDDDRGARHGFCAICAALNLTSSSVLPTIALPLTPDGQPHKWVPHLRPAQFSRSAHFLFQPRAPPYSV
jgi:hypothetical protein